MKISLRGIIIFSMILLSFFGLLTIMSSQSEAESPYYLVLRQLLSFGAATLLMFLCSALPFSFFRKNAREFLPFFRKGKEIVRLKNQGKESPFHQYFTKKTTIQEKGKS